jgi:pyridoxal phosphate-dependent aminotransferase EpsN
VSEALGCGRDEIIEELAREDIEARPLWKPMHKQRLFSGVRCYGGSVAEDLYGRGLCLPSSSSLTDREQDRVIDIVRGLVQGRRRSEATGQ